MNDVRRAGPQEVLPKGTLLAKVTSTLPSIVLRCNRDSQNLFAEALIKRVGYELTGQPGSWGDGAAAIRMYLSEVLDPEAASKVVVDDGSGMSQGNRISPNTFVRLLAHVQNNEPFAEIYLNSLARPGGEGTLESRFRGIDLDGRVYAKSGYISGVTTLSGYLVYPNKKIAFSMMLNKYHMGTASVKRMMENIIDTVDEHVTQSASFQLGG
ncbi:MAG: D-alanyl-D-alanine carboxypeptidase [Planctomycetota bacterium]|jgi:D-alanyl-D-alanine carboxypeptidase/D-alanyl-D-alanine-endopeptidase (penicillin-binding protein 4)